MTDFDTWLHQYRKLYRDDPVKFSSESQNFTDSRLKFRRNFIFILKKMYLLGRSLEMLTIIQHLISTNHNKSWDVLQNDEFIQILAYCYLYVMNDQIGLTDFLNQLYSINLRNHQFQEKVLYLMALSFVNINKVQDAIVLINGKVDKEFYLMNNPKTYAILSHLNELQASQQNREGEQIKNAYSLAKQAQEKNSQRDVQYTELLIQKIMIQKHSRGEEITRFMIKNKYNVYDFTYTLPALLIELQPVKSSLLRKRHLKQLFNKQPWCLVTFKMLAKEYLRKAAKKPSNKVEVLKCLIKYLEYAKDGGDHEQWKFLHLFLSKDDHKMIPDFKDFLQQENALDTWLRVILGANIVQQIRKSLMNRKEEGEYDVDVEKLNNILDIMEYTDINKDKVGNIREYIQKQSDLIHLQKQQ